MPATGDFLQQLQATFRVEAREHVHVLSRGILALEKAVGGQEQSRIVETIFRAAHSLKGAARAAEFGDVEIVCQSLEDVLAALRRQPQRPSRQATDTLHRALDAIAAMLDGDSGSTSSAEAKANLPPLRRQLRELLDSFRASSTAPAPVSSVGPPPAESPARRTSGRRRDDVHPAAMASDLSGFAKNTVRVPLSKLESQLLETEELLVTKLAVHQRASELAELEAWFKHWRNARDAVDHDARILRSARPSSMPQLGHLLDFIEWGDAAVRALEARLAHIGRQARSDSDTAGKSIDNLLESAKQLLLLPFSTISVSFPKLVRDLCRSEGKEADLVISGDHVELDKRILEEMKDPLVHMLRNAVDHAVELPAMRVAQGKRARATLSLEVSQIDGSRVQIVVKDDGAGIDADAVKVAALRRGLISESDAERLDDIGAQALIFRSEVTSGSSVTELSGRGLGLAIVHENTMRLGGEVRVRSERGRGTDFTIVLPAVRATFRGILCEVAGRPFLMPVATVQRVTRVALTDVQRVEGHDTIRFDGRVVPLVRLADVLEIRVPPTPQTESVQAIVVGSADQTIAFAVDTVLQEQEVLVKPLTKPLVRVRNIAAAALLGSGTVVPVLNATDLLKSVRHGLPSTLPEVLASPAVRTPPKSILVAEDSITSRMLLKAILESAGYRVRTAVDGMDAYSLLRSEPFSLLVSDVEMPRLNGFDLTARIRSDARLAELPVVLVTALATPEDRERGIDVGANAYIVKGSFDQENLIETVARLV